MAEVPAGSTDDDGDRFPTASGNDTGAPAAADDGPVPTTPPPASAGDGDGTDPPMDAEPMAPPQPMVPVKPPEPPDEPALPPLGGVLDTCSIDEGCMGELVCFQGEPGFCAEPCEGDGDCGEHAGYAFTCMSAEQACRVPCEDDEQCPPGFACEGNEGFFDTRRCTPKLIPGAGDRGPLEPCDVKRGDTDCVDGLICYRWDDTRVDGPGYCTVPCDTDDDDACAAMVAAGAELGCGSEGACRFRCTNAPCPAFMECEEIEGTGRCKYPADTPY